MRELSLGWRTDLIFARFDAEVIARTDYLLVRTAHNPTFWWGNFLLFDRVPVEGDAARWLAHFESEIASRQSESRHVAFGVDGHESFDMPADLLRAGFSRHAATVLTMQGDALRVPPPPRLAGFRIAALELPAQASVAVEQQVASDEGEHQPVEDYRLFRARQMRRYGAMQQAGLGRWFGAFARDPDGEHLIADCGLFRDDTGPHALGRFQFVSTHPAWRRRGVCRALIHAVCRHGFEVMGLHTLVIVADPDDVAIALYESIGFERGASHWHIERRPAPPRDT